MAVEPDPLLPDAELRLEEEPGIREASVEPKKKENAHGSKEKGTCSRA
ncbi:MAG: hypothetical protein GY822_19730 [Deltaproteobacteria bacterium]|nr:hypothetical protein [Deltaproteobacteria bacterium]